MSFAARAFAIVLGFTMAAALAAPVSAAGIKLGKPGYGGTGCPAGTASVSSTSGGAAISVKFSKFQASAGGKDAFGRVACGLSIPVSVPSGQAVAVVGIDYVGYTNLPAGANATFKSEQFIAGATGPVFSKVVAGPKKGKFTATNTAALSWSACGASSVILRTQTSLVVQTTGGKPASASVRSQDAGAAIVYRLKFKGC